MGHRTATYSGAPKVLPNLSATTITWTASEIDSTGVVLFMLGLQPVGNTIAVVDRVRIRAAGQLVMDVTLTQLLAFQAAYSKANVSDATTGNILYIPLNLLDAPTQEARDSCQFPPGAEAQVEVVFLATVVTGTAILGWQISDQKPKYYQRLISSQSNIPASTNNAKFIFSESGVIRALGFNTAGVNRAEATISGQRAWNLPGTQFQALAYGDLLSEKDTPEFGSVVAAQAYRLHAIDLLLAGASGSTNLVLDTGAGWGGVANEVLIYSVSEVAQFRG